MCLAYLRNKQYAENRGFKSNQDETLLLINDILNQISQKSDVKNIKYEERIEIINDKIRHHKILSSYKKRIINTIKEA